MHPCTCRAGYWQMRCISCGKQFVTPAEPPRQWPSIWAVLFVGTVSAAAGWFVFVLTHPPVPTAELILSCRSSYGCNLGDLLAGR